MQTFWSILEKVKGSALRLTKMDDDIYAHLKQEFPEFDPAATIDEDHMKSKAGKERWRKFMMSYEKKIDDYNFGTMVRNNAKVEYEEDTTIFGRQTRTPQCNGGTDDAQFPACSSMRLRLPGTTLSRTTPEWKRGADARIRNKNGLNDWVYEQAQAQSNKSKHA